MRPGSTPKATHGQNELFRKQGTATLDYCRGPCPKSRAIRTAAGTGTSALISAGDEHGRARFKAGNGGGGRESRGGRELKGKGVVGSGVLFRRVPRASSSPLHVRCALP